MTLLGSWPDPTGSRGDCSSHRSSHATALAGGGSGRSGRAGRCASRGVPGRSRPGTKTTDAAPPSRCDDRADDAASMPLLWSQLVALRHGGSALGLAQTSPDSVRLTDAQCVVETRLAHRTCGTDGLGLFFAPQLLALALEVRRWKEDDGLRATACSSNLPVFLDALCTHRHTPLPGADHTADTYPRQGKVGGSGWARAPTISQVSTLVNAR